MKYDRLYIMKSAKNIKRIFTCVFTLVPIFISTSGTLRAHTIERISVASNGYEREYPAQSNFPSISADGRFVVYASWTNPVPWLGWWPTTADFYVYDRQAKTVEQVNVNDWGVPANWGSYDYNVGGVPPSISADGHYVAFVSSATNLVPGDTNSAIDVFVYNRWNKTIRRVSVNNTGDEGDYWYGSSMSPSINADGRYVAFESMATNFAVGDTNGWQDIFIYDCQTNMIELVSKNAVGEIGNSASVEASISADGRFVAFNSYASNLVPGDDNDRADIFIKDRLTGTVERASNATTGGADWGSWSPSISADGRYVAFFSYSTDIVLGDTNDMPDIFVYDRQSITVERISVDDFGNQANSANYYPNISGDGNYVAFLSYATNLVPGDNNGVADIFVYNRVEKTIQRISTDSSGGDCNGPSSWPRLSDDGKIAVFGSNATNLVNGDTNGIHDVFVAYCYAETCTPTATPMGTWYTPTPTETRTPRPTNTLLVLYTHTPTATPTPTYTGTWYLQTPTWTPSPTVTDTQGLPICTITPVLPSHFNEVEPMGSGGPSTGTNESCASAEDLGTIGAGSSIEVIGNLSYSGNANYNYDENDDMDFYRFTVGPEGIHHIILDCFDDGDGPNEFDLYVFGAACGSPLISSTGPGTLKTLTSPSLTTGQVFIVAVIGWTGIPQSSYRLVIEPPVSMQTITPTHSPAPDERREPFIFPNPSDGTQPIALILPSGTTGEVIIKIFTVAFRKVIETRVPDASQSGRSIPLEMRDQWGSILANGLYYVSVETNRARYIAKWLVLR